MNRLVLKYRIAAVCIGIIAGYTTLVQAMPPAVTPFSAEALKSWKERVFSGNTLYELVEIDEITVLKGYTNGTASVLFNEQSVDLESTPLVSWAWKVSQTYTEIDEKSRQGDDFPARLYVVARTGFLPWEVLTINYVWASEAKIGEDWISPYTDRSKMIVVQSGNEHAGRWSHHQRNVADDFKQFFGEEVDTLSGYAVMVDGDNTGMEATAWFSGIQFVPENSPN